MQVLPVSFPFNFKLSTQVLYEKEIQKLLEQCSAAVGFWMSNSFTKTFFRIKYCYLMLMFRHEWYMADREGSQGMVLHSHP